MSEYKPKVGDRVRVVLEGEVSWAAEHRFDVKTSDGKFVGGDLGLAHLTSVEKLAPPVETFKAGDVVRSKSVRSWLYAIGSDGYIELPGGKYRPHGFFTSEHYERVVL